MKGKGFVKVTSILMIIGGSISAIAGILGFLGISAAAVMMGSTEGIGLLYATTALVAFASIIQIIAGVKGLKACKSPELAEKCIVYGLVIAVLTFISIGINLLAGGEFNFLSLVINLMVPGLYIYGLVQLKNGQEEIVNI